MAANITFRLDEDAHLALDELTADGTPTSTVVRHALIETAVRHGKAWLRAEVPGTRTSCSLTNSISVL